MDSIGVHPVRSAVSVTARVAPGPASGTSTITFRTRAMPGVLAAFTGALAAERLDIISAYISLSADGTVTDSFDVVRLEEHEHAPIDANQLADLAEQVIGGRRDLSPDLAALRAAHPARADIDPRVEIDVDSELTTGIKVVCADRPGVLHDIAASLSRHSMRTRSIAVLTHGGRAYDTFRIVDSAGLPPSTPGVLEPLRRDLLRVCAS